MSVLINDEISSSIDYWRLFSCSVTFQEEIRLNEPPSNTKVKCSLHFTFLELANRPCLTIPNFLSVIKDDYRRHFQFFLAIDKYNWWFYSIVLRKKKKVLITTRTSSLKIDTINGHQMIQKYTFPKIERENCQHIQINV